MPKNSCIMQIWAESGKSALPICNYSQILYQFLTFTQNLKRSQIEGTELPKRLDILGYINKQITLIIIKDGKVDKKYHPLPPKILTNVIKCKNPRCITSIETGCEHIFKLYPSGKYRCLYCNEEISVR